jgi:phosphohistidine phosphatase
MIIGHNPGLHELGVSLLASKQTAGARENADRLMRKFPTAALAIFDFGVTSWRALKPGTGTLPYYVWPKDILASDEDGE